MHDGMPKSRATLGACGGGMERYPETAWVPEIIQILRHKLSRDAGAFP